VVETPIIVDAPEAEVVIETEVKVEEEVINEADKSES
jgi:hypothetical protein